MSLELLHLNRDSSSNGIGATFGNIQIAVADDQTIDTSSGNLVLDAATNRVKINAATDITGDTVITGILSVTMTSQRSTVLTQD